MLCIGLKICANLDWNPCHAMYQAVVRTQQVAAINTGTDSDGGGSGDGGGRNGHDDGGDNDGDGADSDNSCSSHSNAAGFSHSPDALD